MSGPAYDFKQIEAKWQQAWRDQDIFRTPNPGDPDFDPAKPKFYVLDMFPYPSGAGLHVGHPLGYIGTDIVARYKRMTGHNVLHPMGFDAFGLPAEQYAIEHGVHPRETTETNIANMRRQLQAFGLSYDWSREIKTIDPPYYRWTQWIFLQLRESYLDPSSQKARPISELVRQLEAGSYLIDARGKPIAAGDDTAGRRWHTLRNTEQRTVLDDLRLAYVAEVPVNWCPALGTALANEEVTNEGRSERGNHPVYKRPLLQWMLRITAYADRLLADLDLVDWPEPIKQMQRNWIGRSEGARVSFARAGGDEVIEVFTTRPDTLFGATYMVLAPEHPLVGRVTTDAQRAQVKAYQAQTATRSDVDRQAETKTKTGVFTGSYAINPTNEAKIPIWIADYVLMGYGTGAIMAVPAHDQRDFEFACQFDLPIVPVVMPDEAWLRQQGPLAQRPLQDASLAALAADYLGATAAYPVAFCGEGRAVHSENETLSLDGLATGAAKARITAWLAQRGTGAAQVQYKLRDWLFSRQRYWGEPIPVLHTADGEILAVDEKDLPVELPEMADFRPQTDEDANLPPRPSLARAPQSWITVKHGSQITRRELNTMPQWAGSCWYYLRFIDPHNTQQLVSPAIERYWMGENGVDLYVGGAEHAVLHLLYARFWHKVLFDLGQVSTPEPFGRLFNQGYILAYAYQDQRGAYVPADEIEERDGQLVYQGNPVTRQQGKMGKSLKNAVNPDDIFVQYGCDTLRLYEMYLGPLETSKPWNTRDIIGVHRFLQRIWRNFVDQDRGTLRVSDETPSRELQRQLHQTIKRVTEDMDRLHFNTAIAALIALNNALVPLTTVPRQIAEPFVLMLGPLCPHIAEELWQRLGQATSLAYAPWPAYDAAYLVQDEITVVVQITGKTRGQVAVAADADQAAVQAAALADPKIAKFVEGKAIRRVVYVPGRLINIVAA